MDEIPEALRDNPKLKQSSWQVSTILVGGLLGIGMLGIFAIIFWLRPAPQTQNNSPVTVTPDRTPTPTPTTEPVENVLGHLPYNEAPQSELRAVTPDGRIRLRKSAAEAFEQMQASARASGVILTSISGFRSLEEQNNLFFKSNRNEIKMLKSGQKLVPRQDIANTIQVMRSILGMGDRLPRI